MTTSDEAVTAERRARNLSALLHAADDAPRPVEFPARRIEVALHGRRRLITWRWRIAAALVVMLSGAVMVQPVRAWIGDAARNVWLRVAGYNPPQPSRPESPAPVPAEPANRVSFAPPPDIFVLEIATRQAAGQLTLAATPGSSAVAEVAGSAGDAELVVMPDGLRIVNRATASSQYTVRVPATLVRVVVRVGRESAVLFTPAPDARPLVLELGRIR